MGFAENLKRLRKEKGISRAEIAKILNMTENAFGTYERGEREPPIEKLCKIAAALHVTTDELLGYQVDEYEQCKDLLRLAKIPFSESKTTKKKIPVITLPYWGMIDIDKEMLINCVNHAKDHALEAVLNDYLRLSLLSEYHIASKAQDIYRGIAIENAKRSTAHE